MIDTHSHIYDEIFDSDRDEVIARAKESGITRIILPAIDSHTHQRMLHLAQSDDIFIPAMGLHPTSVNDNPQWRDELDVVEKYLSDNSQRFCAVGEVGMDLYWSKEFESQQKEVFASQIELSLKYNLPLIIHVRSAWSETLDTLEGYKGRGIRGVMHTFSGTYQEYVKIKECGEFFFGIGGVVTYKKGEIADLLPRMSINDIVLETDAPYLTPVPLRGKRNESSYLRYICAKVAQILNMEEQEVDLITTRNSKKLFGL